MKEMTSDQLFDYFQENAICESLTRQDVEVMSHFLQEKTFKRGDIINDMGDVGDSMYFIVQGRVGFSASDGQDEAEVGMQARGNLIGEMSFFDRKPRMLRMKAASKEVFLLEITRPMYDRLKVEHPYIAVNLVENAVVSLDHLIRALSSDLSQFEHYMHGYGRH
ncbi:Crp/Fnr family transcriptional regulator [Thiomicrospira sp. WB1]|jgi:CRP-like cAMP-binding protein|uniref:Crp/Fnr family transcriptional regulator n=1 Tax=Thiomicrospira sp. WB1 TaxID=1685380 RepID=UPI000748D942|nr:cyclic nucleotide-binding domain-containing protein [Thiomicrospira sp. WB1]KUJ71979.1 cyclic nucleotide-binding protein [Thiomicrospira sp. WB1]